MEIISDRICYVGVNDRSTTLFEGLWPLPHGISYNSYSPVQLPGTGEKPEPGVTILEGGLAFPQAFSDRKFPVDALADAIADE